MTTMRQRMMEDLQIRNYAPATLSRSQAPRPAMAASNSQFLIRGPTTLTSAIVISM